MYDQLVGIFTNSQIEVLPGYQALPILSTSLMKLGLLISSDAFGFARRES
jgi:hypothetical protein